jgi:carbohydrate-selective porin OprB
MIPSREADAVGLYISHARLSNAAGAGFAEDETAIETYYRFQVTPALFVQAGLQAIRHPSGDAATRYALVGGIRVGVTF